MANINECGSGKTTTTIVNSNYFTASITKLNGKNYKVWKMRLTSLFKTHDLMSIVDGSRIQPLITDVDERQIWDKDNNEAFSILLTSMVDSEVEFVLGCETAHQVWTTLRSIYESGESKQVLWEQFMAIQDQDKSPVKIMIHITNIAAQLRSLGVQIDKEMEIARVISALNDEKFRQFQEAWQCVETNRQTSVLLLSRLKIWELEDQERVKNHQKSFKKFSFNGHKAYQTDESNKNNRKMSKEEIEVIMKKTKCHLCRKVGHWKFRCPEKNTEKEKPKPNRCY